MKEQTTFAGMSYCTWHEMTFNDFIDFLKGRTVIAIGKGNFDDVMYENARMTLSWYEWQQYQNKKNKAK